MRFGPIWLVCAFVFLLYILWGRSSKRGAATPTLRGYKAGAIFEGVVADLFQRGSRIVERKEQAPDGRGGSRTGAGGETAAPGFCLQLERGGLPWARCVSPPMEQESTDALRKGWRSVDWY